MAERQIPVRELIVVGAGALGRQVGSLVAELAGAPFRITGYLDRSDPAPRCTPLLGGDEELTSADAAYVIAIGDPTVRRRVDIFATRWNRHPATLVHPACTLDDGVALGAGTITFPGARIQVQATLGRHVLVNANAVVGHDCLVGDHVVLSPLAMLCGGVEVGDAAFIGASAVVLPGRVIGPGATVGAGAVVTSDVPPLARVAGVPARNLPRG
ncbi:acetyltransferase [Kribbella jejuensis]|uniref:Sugar O-acyltransferase (Sialic acid O-acetyltransferase NeuD family) n=1 Tax=Kribbella jejuensis TaxID=236068 RepID=A0A542ERP2_9ACTN|nr:NeuD/PglB/VioB family sugar acetyltransferase [Kribbella jejuensis]TQJ18029.1 sugar O-acyltransferase (sialic acid O-acetyltransferase NeuD family) [Kribbella jejuensis]